MIIRIIIILFIIFSSSIIIIYLYWVICNSVQFYNMVFIVCLVNIPLCRCLWHCVHMVRTLILQQLIIIISSKAKQIAGLWPLGLHIMYQGDSWRTGEQKAGQWAVGLIVPEDPIIWHPPWDLSVQPATAVLPQLWIIGHVRRHHTTLSSPELEPNAQRGSFLAVSLSLTYTYMCVAVCVCARAHIHVPLDCNESRLIVTPSWNLCLSRHICGTGDLADQAHFCTNPNIIRGFHLNIVLLHFENCVERECFFIQVTNRKL